MRYTAIYTLPNHAVLEHACAVLPGYQSSESILRWRNIKKWIIHDVTTHPPPPNDCFLVFNTVGKILKYAYFYYSQSLTLTFICMNLLVNLYPRSLCTLYIVMQRYSSPISTCVLILLPLVIPQGLDPIITVWFWMLEIELRYVVSTVWKTIANWLVFVESSQLLL